VAAPEKERSKMANEGPTKSQTLSAFNLEDRLRAHEKESPMHPPVALDTTLSLEEQLWQVSGGYDNPDTDPPLNPSYVLTSDGLYVEARIADRLARCGSFCHGINPATGEPRAFRYQCGLFHICPHCAKDRADAEKTLVINLAGGFAPFRELTLSEDEARKFIRNFRENKDSFTYRRYPQEDGSVVILHTNPELAGEMTNVNALDWETLVKTPQGKNMSGKTNSKPAKQVSSQDDDNGKVIVCESISAERPFLMSRYRFEELMVESWEFAVMKTAHLAPDIETLELCMQARMDAFRLQLDNAGLPVVFSVSKRQRVRDSQINWVPYNEKILKSRRILTGMAFETMDQANSYSATHLRQ